MILAYRFAPAHISRLCAGVFVWGLLVAGCERAAEPGARGPRTLELDGDTLQLEADVSLYDVNVRSTQQGDFEPVRITAGVGDIVRFRSNDSRTHGIVITAPTPEAAALLDASGQRRSPPLVARGQAWVLSLHDLPPGTYTITCISHAGTASLTVQ